MKTVDLEKLRKDGKVVLKQINENKIIIEEISYIRRDINLEELKRELENLKYQKKIFNEDIDKKITELENTIKSLTK